MEFLNDMLSSVYILYVGLLIHAISFLLCFKGGMRGIFIGGILYFSFLIVVVHFGNDITAFSEYSGDNFFLYISSGIVTLVFGALIIVASFSVFGVFPFTFTLGIVGFVEGIKFLVRKIIGNKEGKVYV